MATINLGRVAYVNRGAYDSTTSYEKHDVVTYNNGSYVFIGDASAAGKEPTDNSYWMPMLDPTDMNAAVNRANEASDRVNEASDRANAAAEAAEETTANIQNEVNSKAVAISETASGVLIHIPNCGAAPVQSLITHIEPKQEGSGDPSPNNKRPIIGWNEMSVTGARKNIFDVNSIELLATENNNDSASLRFGIKLYGPQKYTVGCKEFSVETYIYAKRILADGSLGEVAYIATPQFAQSRTFELAENEGFIVYDAKAVLTKEASIERFIAAKTQVEIGDIATGYEPYQGKTLTASLPETLYGFGINWTTGLVTVTHIGKSFTGNEPFKPYSTGLGYYYINHGNGIRSITGICSHFRTNSYTEFNQGNIGVYMDSSAFVVFTTAFNTVDDWTNYLKEQNANGTPVQVCYKLEAPYTIQLTPQQMETLKGTNNIWSDAGETEVVYAFDTKEYVDAIEVSRAPAIIENVSGGLVTINDQVECVPIKSLITTITPTQEGSGDPSPDNVRPITGWNKVVAQRTGKNLVGFPGFVDQKSSDIRVDTKAAMEAVQFKPNTQYTISANLESSDTTSNAGFEVLYTDGTKRFMWLKTGDTYTKSTTTLADKSVESMLFSYNSIHNVSISNVQIEEGTVATPYEPYTGQTLTADLPETVYGGTLDWTTGLVTVTQERFVFNGQESGWWRYTGNSSGRTHGVFAFDYNKFALGYDTSKCSHFANNRAVFDTSGKSGQYSDHLTVRRKYFGWGTFDSTADEFKAWLAEQYAAGTPVTVVYKLAEPYTIQLTPQQMETLKGINNIWSDAGETEVTYVADTKRYIDKKIAAIAAAIV